MTSTLLGVATATPGERAPRRTRWATSRLILVMLLVFGVAAGLVFYELSIGHALYGLTEYDDGAYFGATMHFVAGQLPYRDFVLVQPPGITLLMAPVALIVGHAAPDQGLAIARIITGVVEGANAVLIVWLLRHQGLLACFAGGLLFAVYPTAFDSDHTMLLEPYMSLFCLMSVALAFRNGELASDRRLFWAGIALGFAGAIKLFAVAIAVAFLVTLAWRNRRALRPLALGAFLGFIIPCLPFFIGAPSGFIHDVFTSQLSRNTAAPTPIGERISATVGLKLSTFPKDLALGPDSPWPWLAGGILSAVVIIGSVLPGLVRRASTFTWFILFGALTSFGMVLIPQQFYTHYAYLAGLFFAIVLGGIVGTATSSITRRYERRHPVGRLHGSQRGSVGLRITGTLTAVVFAISAVVVLHIETTYQRTKILRYGDPNKSLDLAIPAGSCAISDAEILLVVANRLNFSSSCPIMDDATGTWLTYAPKYPPQRNNKEPKDSQLVALWKHELSHVQYATFAGIKAFRTPFTPTLSAWFNDNFVRVPGAAPITFERRPHPISGAPATPGVVP